MIWRRLHLIPEDVVAESLTVSGADITFNGLSTDDGNTATNDLPDSWTEGAIVELIVPDSYVVTNDGAYSRITSDTLEEIAPYIGMPVTLWYNSIDYQLFIADYIPIQNQLVKTLLWCQSLWRMTALPAPHLREFLKDTFVYQYRTQAANIKFWI